MPIQLLTKAAYARHRGCDEKAVRQAITAGRISTINGRIDPVVADAQWKANTRARAPSPGSSRQHANASANHQLPQGGLSSGGTGDDDYSRSRARREAAEAELAELKLAEQRGDLIRVSAVETVWSSSLAAAREHLLQVRARLAPLLAAEPDVFKIEQLLDDEHSQALRLLSSATVRKQESQ